jgi:hypothetical protein
MIKCNQVPSPGVKWHVFLEKCQYFFMNYHGKASKSHIYVTSPKTPKPQNPKTPGDTTFSLF